MQKKIFFLCMSIVCLGLCACQKDASGAIPEAESAPLETGQTVEAVPLETEQTVEPTPSETEQTAEQGENWKEAYQKLLLEEDVKRMALVYLDKDAIPELLVLQNGEYHLYTFDGSQIKVIDMPNAGIRAKAYAPRHALEHSAGDFAFYWFEYVPYRGLIRVHDSESGERCDYYLSYEDGSLTLELEAKFTDYVWHTYNTQQEIANEDFLSGLSERGYDQLIPCGFLYDNIEDSYKNIDKALSNSEVLDDFINGKIDALYEVEEITDIPEDGFIMRSYVDLYMDFIMGDGMGRMQYVDFDNDGEDELVMRDYMGNSIFLDVIGNTVYNVMEAYGTADQSDAAEMDGKRVIVSADVSHGGRKYYFIRQYDSCGCLVDFYRLSASYDGKDHYSAEDEFKYREQPITLEEFEEIRDRIQDIPADKSSTTKKDELPEEFDSFKGKWAIGKYIGACPEEPYEEMSVEQKEWYEEWNAEYRESFEGYTFEISNDSITYFMAPCELSYHYDEYKDLLDFYQYSPNLEIVPPYLYAWVRLKEQGENFGIIIDGNGDAILEVGGRFFELDRKN